jgi:hypothetical protein
MALEEEFEYLCEMIIRYLILTYFDISAFRCAYCNYYNSSRKQKPVFQGNIVVHDPPPTTTNQPQNQSTVERMEVSSSESSDSSKSIAFCSFTYLQILSMI